VIPLAVTENVLVPALIGIPVMTPIPNESPSGSEPNGEAERIGGCEWFR
jgi:hypothetical protein